MNGRLTVEWLRQVEAVTDAGSFSSAARRLEITQPALSSSVSKLESYLGGKMFLRNARGVSLTPFGEAILPKIRQILSSVTAMETTAEEFISSAPGTLRVGVSPPIKSDIVAVLREAVQGPDALSQGRELTILEAELDLLEDYLHSGQLDLLIVGALGMTPGYSRALVDYDYLVLVDPDDIKDKTGINDVSDETNSQVTVKQLSQQELILSRNGCGITRLVKEILSEEHLPLRQADVEVSSCANLLGWAERGMGHVVLPEKSVTENLTLHRIRRRDGTLAEIFFEAVWNPESRNAAYLESIVALFQQPAHN